jgi:hypothetical protein
MYSGERAQSLVEVIVGVGIMAVVVASTLGAVVAATHRFGADPAQSALEASVASEMRVATDLLKYQGATISPTSVATTIPLPSASPLAATMSISTTTLANGGVSITIAGITESPPHSYSTTTTLSQRALPPGSQVVAPTTIAAPTGAP